jgi:hypothetical protein
VIVNEESEIRAEVEKRKRRAWETGIVINVLRLFHERLGDFTPNTDYREYQLPESVRNVVVTALEQAGKSVEIFFEERSYKFSSSISVWPDLTFEGGETIRSQICLRSGADLLLELECSRTTPIFGREYIYGRDLKVDEVLAFVEGPWVQEINDFSGKVFYAEDMQKAKMREEQKQRELQEMKNRFGL